MTSSYSLPETIQVKHLNHLSLRVIFNVTENGCLFIQIANQNKSRQMCIYTVHVKIRPNIFTFPKNHNPNLFGIKISWNYT